MRILAPFGFYGSGNIGDEATLKGFAQLVHAYGRPMHIAVASENPKHTAHAEPAFHYHSYSGGIIGMAQKINAFLSQGYVFPGGTPIMDGLGGWPLDALAPMVEHAHRWGKPAVFVGIGVERLNRMDSKAIVRERIAPHVAHWTVRSSRDQERLIELDVPASRITVAADMAWLMPKADLDYGRRALGNHLGDGRPLIGVNVNAETSVMERAPHLLEKLAAALDALVDQHGARIVFLFNEVRDGPTYDVAAAARVKAAMRRSDAAVALPNDYLTPPEMMSIIGHCALTISTRYHFCLFSALQGVPFLALRRSDKVNDLCTDLGWDYGAAVEEADESALSAQARSLLSDAGPELQKLSARIGDMKRRAMINAQGLDALLVKARQVQRSAVLRKALARAAGRS